MAKLDTILVADDDREIVELVADALDDEGYYVLKAYQGKQAVDMIIANKEALDMIVLDIMMPEMSGLDVCRQIRHELDVPILLLSAKDRELDKVIGLEVGADDYLTKPFSVNELVARIKAHLRREKRKQLVKTISEGEVVFADIRMNRKTYEVFKGEEALSVSTKEFQILSYMYDNQNIVLTREQIYDAVWGYSEFADINTVTVHIKNLRAKLDPNNKHIVTVWGVGYKFVC